MTRNSTKQTNSLLRFISGEEGLMLEQKIFNTASFVFFVISFFVTIGSVVNGDIFWICASLLVISSVFLIIFYQARFHQKFFISKSFFILLTLLFNDIAWCWSVALTPVSHYFLVLIVVVDLTILKVKDHPLFILLTVINLLLLDGLAYIFPEQLIHNYELLPAIQFPFNGHLLLILLILFISLVISIFKKHYELERNVSIEVSRQLMNNNTGLKNRNEHLESTARMVSHNLRSPVAGLKMLLQLAEKLETDEERAELRENFLEGLDLLFVMVEDLSQIMMDYRELVKDTEEIELADAFENVKTQLAPQIKEVNAKVEGDFSDYPFIHYSPLFLNSILLNLVGNAIKYRAESRDPLLQVKSFVEGNKVMLSVRDNGIGIDLEKHRDKVFQMYKTFHADDSIDSRGVGLFIVKNQVEMLGGKIIVKSKIDVGTEFLIELYRL